MTDPSAWNSLEVAKLIVGALTPLTVALLGIWVARATRKLEASQWVNQKLIEKRIDLLEEILPCLNDLYCYFEWIGNWKELSPADAIKRKRELDKTFFANRAFFSDNTIIAYQEFSAILFKTYAAPGVDALLRTAIESHHGNRMKTYPGEWKPEWTTMFSEEKEQKGRAAIGAQYQALTSALSTEIGIARDSK